MELPDKIKVTIFSHFDVITLINKKHVCQLWNRLCTDAINAKLTQETRIPCASNAALHEAVRRYCGYQFVLPEEGGMPLVYINDIRAPDHEEAERIAQVHGWPINL